MTVVLVVLAAAAVIAIALVAVGRVTNQLSQAPPQVRYDLPAALDGVVAALPADVTAQLSYDQVEALLKAHLDYLNANDLLDGVRYATGDGLIVVADDETLAYLIERAETADWHVTDEQAAEVLEAHLAYLEGIGVIGTRVPDPSAVEDPDGAPVEPPPEEPRGNDVAGGAGGA
ncbi:MAG: hypothetical protein JNK12_01745 [Acidimicrobiales bacterium]|nr:hypothetical protein [Acidimicrobiales bacterium]